MTDDCPVCGHPMGTDPTDTHRRSRDHIIPQAMGGTDVIHLVRLPDGRWDGTRNTRIMCQRCNSHLAYCGGCLGALACVIAIGEPWGSTIKAWRTARRADFKRLVADQTERPLYPPIWDPPRRMNDPDSEWCFPADTPAKRAWNLATMARNVGQAITDGKYR